MSEMKHASPNYPCNCQMPGWKPGIIHVESVAQGYSSVPAGKMKPDAVVMHTVEGWQSTMMSPSWTRNAYHFTIRQDGRQVQHVSIYSAAWHAGNVNQPVWAGYQDRNPNYHCIGISGEGTSGIGANPYKLPLAWTEEQVESAIELLRWIRDEARIRFDDVRLTEHSQIDTVNRNDPGPRWPKKRVLAALNEEPPKEAKKMSNAYIVQAGDTLGAIAKLFGQDVAALVARNGIADPNRITAGQLLYLADVPHPHVCGAVERPDVKPLRNRLEVITKSAQWLDDELAKIGGV